MCKKLPSILRGLLATSLVILDAPLSRAEGFTVIPVIVNILTNAGITEEEAKKAISDANEILKKAKAKLTVIKVRKDVKDGDNGDLTLEEWAKVDIAGKKEVSQLVDEDGVKRNQKGKKIVFAKSLPKTRDNKDVVGVSGHRGSVVQIAAGAIRSKVPAADFANQLRKTLAHEVLHNAKN